MKELKIESDNGKSSQAEVKSERNEDDPFAKSSPFVSWFIVGLCHWRVHQNSLSSQSLEWIFGFNSDVPLINLTVDSSAKLFSVTSGHAFQIFRCDDNSMQSFVGHVSARLSFAIAGMFMKLNFVLLSPRRAKYLHWKLMQQVDLSCQLTEREW